jgi:hypothetical protein
MDILKKIREELVQQKEPNAYVQELFKTGSQLFRDAPADLDYVAVCQGYTQRRRKVVFIEDGDYYDVTLISPEAVLAQLDFNDSGYTHYKTKLFNYLFLVKDVVYGSYIPDWDIFEHEAEYKAYIKEHYLNGVGKSINKKNFGKFFVHYYIIQKIYERQSLEVTPEMLADIKHLYAKTEEADEIINKIILELERY